MTALVPSAQIETFVKSFEKCRLQAYKPTPVDHWTCGWGTTGPDVGPDTVWTQEQADLRFDQDMGRFGGAVFVLLRIATSQNQYDAMVSLAYNIGLGNYSGSTVLRDHNAGDFVNAASGFALWNKQRDSNGNLIVLDGLTKRRAAEAALYRL